MDEITHARVLRIALPIVLANVTVPLLGAVDTAVVGQIGLAAPIGAVGLGAVVLASIYWIFGFLRMGTSGLAAQAEGAKDPGESTAILLRALIIGAAAGLILITLKVPLTGAALVLSPGSAEVEALARDYLAIRLWGAPAAIALYAITGWLIARERTGAVLGLQIFINGINIVLDLWFVLGLGWGVAGVAQATLIAEWGGLGLGLWLCRAAFGVALGPALARLGDRRALRRMITVNGDIMIRSVLLQASFTSFVFLGARLGDVTLAANQVLLQFLIVAANFLDGFAFAAEALVGRAVGARSVPRLWRATLVTSQWAVASVALLALAIMVAGPQIIDLMAAAPEVRVAALRYLPWLIAAPLLGVAGWMFDGIFIGATATRDMRNAMLVSVAIYGAALALLVPGLGNHGLWAALNVLFVARGLTLAALYRRIERAAAG